MIVTAVMVVMAIFVIGLLLLTWALMCTVAGQEGEDDDAQEQYLAEYRERESRRRFDRARRRKERKQRFFDFWLNLFYPRS